MRQAGPARARAASPTRLSYFHAPDSPLADLQTCLEPSATQWSLRLGSGRGRRGPPTHSSRRFSPFPRWADGGSRKQGLQGCPASASSPSLLGRDAVAARRRGWGSLLQFQARAAAPGRTPGPPGACAGPAPYPRQSPVGTLAGDPQGAWQAPLLGLLRGREGAGRPQAVAKPRRRLQAGESVPLQAKKPKQNTLPVARGPGRWAFSGMFGASGRLPAGFAGGPGLRSARPGVSRAWVPGRAAWGWGWAAGEAA